MLLKSKSSGLGFFPPGSDVVEWLFHHIEGFQDRREARKYASNLLKAGFIRHTVNKITFSEQCYYVFGDLSDCENCKSLTTGSFCHHHKFQPALFPYMDW